MGAWAIAWGAFERLTTVAMFAAAIAVGWNVIARTSGDGGFSGEIARPAIAIDGAIDSDEMKIAARKGSESAKVAVIEFADFECPFCKSNARDVHPMIEREYVKPGKIRYLFYTSRWKACILERAASLKSLSVQDSRDGFGQRNELLFKRDGTASDVPPLAAEIGADDQVFGACMRGPVSEPIATNVKLGRYLGVQSTPTFVFGTFRADGSIALRSRIAGALPFREFKKVLDELVD